MAKKQLNSENRNTLAIWAIAISALALIVSLGAITGIQESQASKFDPPRDLEALIEKVRESTVTIECEDNIGSGWVLDLEPLEEGEADAETLDIDRMYPTEVITNHHVIEDCIDDETGLTATVGDETLDAVIYTWDEENDLAMLAIKQQVPALDMSDKYPDPGWWVMAVGSPYGLEGSVTLGNVLNLDGYEVITTSPLNFGNSGGPLVDRDGKVLGTNTYTLLSDEGAEQPWHVAVENDALFEVLIEEE